MAVKLLRFILASYKINFKTAMEYRLSFIGQLISMIINDIFWIIFWYIFFTKVSSVKGWEFKDVLLLFAMIAYSLGIGAGFFANASEIGKLIEEGGLDFYLVLPKDPLLNILVGRISASSMGDVFFGIILFFIVEGLNYKKLLCFLIIGLFGGIIMTSFRVTVYSITFFLSRGSNLGKVMVEALYCFSMYPISIFQGFARLILFTIIPAAFIGAIPVSLIKDFTWGKMLFLITFTVFSIFISRYVFFYGLKRYTSGNLISARL